MHGGLNIAGWNNAGLNLRGRIDSGLELLRLKNVAADKTFPRKKCFGLDQPRTLGGRRTKDGR
jgi:hypothetical protein